MIAFKMLLFLCHSIICAFSYPLKKISSHDNHHPVTILIHGTRLPPFIMYTIPYLWQQVIVPEGLHKAPDLGSVYHYARLAKTLSDVDPAQFPYEHFYLFGWSGALCFKEREEAGKRLYDEIKKLKSRPEYAHSPLTVITVSHGGNVALNAARQALKHHDHHYWIERLIMLCCPVQDRTEKYIESPLFKNVFSLYSDHEIIQVMDPQGLWYDHEDAADEPATWFSRRTFNTKVHHVVQAEARHADATLSHIDFVLHPFFKALPFILAELKDAERRQKLPKNEAGSFVVDYRSLMMRLKKDH